MRRGRMRGILLSGTEVGDGVGTVDGRRTGKGGNLPSPARIFPHAQTVRRCCSLYYTFENAHREAV